VLARTPGRLDTVVDGQLLVFDPHHGHAHLLNSSAALVLTSVDGRSTAAEIADALSRETGVEPDTISRDVTDVLGTLVQGGLVTWFFRDGPEPDDQLVDARAASTERWRRVVQRRLDARPWSYLSGAVDTGGASVVVRTDDEVLAQVLAEAMEGLPPSPAGATAAASLSVDARTVAGRPRFRVHAGGDRIGWTDHRGDAVGFALAGLNRLVADASSGQQLVLHAGVVERDHRVALLTGPSGRGKSTLTAAVVASGASYVSDELAIIDPVTRFVTPYAKALELDGDAVGRLGLADMSALGAAGRREWHVPPGALGRVSAGGTVSLLVLLEPAGSPDADPTELGPAEAMLRLLPDVLPQTWSMPGALDAVAELCERVPAIALPRLELDEAVAVVDERLVAR
jgi:hypothetical protein